MGEIIKEINPGENHVTASIQSSIQHKQQDGNNE